MTGWRNDYPELSGEELENHLASDCELTIIEPMQTTEYLTPEERELMAQFPLDHPETPAFDEVFTESLENGTAELDLYYRASMEFKEPVGKPFKTARFWCLRVVYA